MTITYFFLFCIHKKKKEYNQMCLVHKNVQEPDRANTFLLNGTVKKPDRTEYNIFIIINK